MNKFKTIGLFLLLISSPLTSVASEGMWLPLLLEGAVEEDMQTMGLKLSAEDIYQINESSLKDAIVNFGGCTASVISPEGLILTNHHCGYSYIQSHSSIEENYLTEGFFASSINEELPNPGLEVYFIKKIEDVTDQVMEGISETISESERSRKISSKIKLITKKAAEGTHYQAFVRPFYYGNEYYLFITEIFKDVRLVAAPPSSIGKYGGDTDNWMWPRHTGDFSLFRIYTAPDGKPAEFSEDNIPYIPDYYLPISLDGVKKDDFTMVFGFPGTTNQYFTSHAVDFLINKLNPERISIREKKLDILDAAMSTNDTVRIRYAAKHARVANYYKKWIGETKGLQQFNAVNKKQLLENQFSEWIQADQNRLNGYGDLLPGFENIYQKRSQPVLVSALLNEAVFGIDIMRLASLVSSYIMITDDNPNKDYQDYVFRYIDRFFKDYHQLTDKKLFNELMYHYYQNADEQFLPDQLNTVDKKYQGDFSRYTESVFKNSILFNKSLLLNHLKSAKKADRLKKDPLIELAEGFFLIEEVQVKPVITSTSQQLEALYRKYVRGLRDMFPMQRFYSDANGTMRVAYGKVEGSIPRDGMKYLHFTTLDGVMQKEDPADREFMVPEKLSELYMKKDYGIYGQNDTLYVCFLASNHTTGGNSGSPVINEDGALIGLNFDRSWESTMSDIMYNEKICRNISVDIRYILFILDKFADADHLVEEMTLVSKTSNILEEVK